jgi:hypothetical protein
MASLRYTPWPGAAAPSTTEIESLLQAEGLDFYPWSNGPDDIYAPHAHTYNKVIYCVRGSITFQLPQERTWHKLMPGDRLDLPAGVIHAAEVGEEGVVCFEAHQYSG